METVKAYAEDKGYWLKLHHFDISIGMSVFDKLEEEEPKDWETWEED